VGEEEGHTWVGARGPDTVEVRAEKSMDKIHKGGLDPMVQQGPASHKGLLYKAHTLIPRVCTKTNE
jgi:hypothetical protein